MAGHTIPPPAPGSGARERSPLSTPQALDLAILLLVAFVTNLPLGYLREGSPRYSLRWFVYIHLSIPLIVAVRLAYGLGWHIVPLSIACAVAGQLFGGRLRRRLRR